MKVWKKCGALFLTVLLCITMMAVPALAASDSQDGFEVTLTTDKEEYSMGISWRMARRQPNRWSL